MTQSNIPNTVKTGKFNLLSIAKRNFSLFAVLITLWSLPLGFSGCSSYMEIEPNQELTILIDRSTSINTLTTDSAIRIYEYAIKTLGITDNTFSSKGIAFRISTVGESARSITKTLTLPPSKSLAFSKKNVRIAEINQFKKELKSIIFEVTKDSADQRLSNIHNTLCYQLNILTESAFSEDKSILLISDGIESTFDLSFEDYRNTPNIITESKPEFSDKLNTICALPSDISNIKITMANSPTLSSSPIVLACDKFWVFHLGKSKGKLNIISNL